MSRAYRLGFYASLAMSFGLGCLVMSFLRDAPYSTNAAERRLFIVAVVLVSLGVSVKSALAVTEGTRGNTDSSVDENDGAGGTRGPDGQST